MKVVRWGNSLAVRLPAKLVRELGLAEGDRIDLIRDNDVLRVQRLPRTREVLDGLRQFRGRLSVNERLGRDDAHSRQGQARTSCLQGERGSVLGWVRMGTAS